MSKNDIVFKQYNRAAVVENDFEMVISCDEDVIVIPFKLIRSSNTTNTDVVKR